MKRLALLLILSACGESPERIPVASERSRVDAEASAEPAPAPDAGTPAPIEPWPPVPQPAPEAPPESPPPAPVEPVVEAAPPEPLPESCTELHWANSLAYGCATGLPPDYCGCMSIVFAYRMSCEDLPWATILPPDEADLSDVAICNPENPEWDRKWWREDLLAYYARARAEGRCFYEGTPVDCELE